MTNILHQRTRFLGWIIALLGVLIAVTPWFIFPVCEVKGITSHAAMQMSHDGSMSMDHSNSSGGTLMKCGYTARVETVIGVLLAITGSVVIARRDDRYRKLGGVATVVLGILAALVPTVLIGVCSSPDAPCRIGTLPALLLLSVLVIIAGAALTLIRDHATPSVS